jgi:hypothetical protein
MTHCSGGAGVSAYWVPQVVQMNAGNGGSVAVGRSGGRTVGRSAKG